MAPVLKLCAICGTACADAEPTCQNCGEASWIFVVKDTKTSPFTANDPCAGTVVHSTKPAAPAEVPIGATVGTVILDEQVPATVKATEAAWTQPSRRDDRHHNRGRR